MEEVITLGDKIVKVVNSAEEQKRTNSPPFGNRLKYNMFCLVQLAEAYMQRGGAYYLKAVRRKGDVVQFDERWGRLSATDYWRAASYMPDDEPGKCCCIYRGLECALRMGGYSFKDIPAL